MKMKIFIDENISPKASEILQSFGHDVSSINSIGLFGMIDEDVFKLAQKENRVLITQNGKHFIIYVPPKCKGISHSGIIWLKTQLTRLNANDICVCINNLFLNNNNLDNSVWIIRQNTDREYIYNSWA